MIVVTAPTGERLTYDDPTVGWQVRPDTPEAQVTRLVFDALEEQLRPPDALSPAVFFGARAACARLGWAAPIDTTTEPLVAGRTY